MQLDFGDLTGMEEDMVDEISNQTRGVSVGGLLLQTVYY